MSFADDTVLYFSGETWTETIAKAQEGVDVVHTWLDNNLLTLNITKTKYLTFSPTISGQPKDTSIILHTCGHRQINCTCKTIDRTEKIKYLGLTVDNNLKWTHHILDITKRLRKLTYIFVTLRDFLTIAQLKTVYFALCQSLLSYGIAAWGGAYRTTLIPLVNVQKLLLRILMRKPPLSSSKELFQQLNLLNIQQLYVGTILTIFHQHNTLNPTPHPYSTRTQANNIVPKMSKAFGQKHMVFLAPRLYNKLPADIKKIKNAKKFKTRVSKWLITIGEDGLNAIFNILT